MNNVSEVVKWHDRKMRYTEKRDTRAREQKEYYRSLRSSVTSILIGTVSLGSSIVLTIGERFFVDRAGDAAMVDRSSSLCGPRVGLEPFDLEVASASSLRKASNSFSNLCTCKGRAKPQAIQDTHLRPKTSM